MFSKPTNLWLNKMFNPFKYIKCFCRNYHVYQVAWLALIDSNPSHTYTAFCKDCGIKKNTNYYTMAKN